MKHVEERAGTAAAFCISERRFLFLSLVVDHVVDIVNTIVDDRVFNFNFILTAVQSCNN